MSNSNIVRDNTEFRQKVADILSELNSLFVEVDIELQSVRESIARKIGQIEKKIEKELLGIDR